MKNNNKTRIVILSILSTVAVFSCLLFCINMFKQPKASEDTLTKESISNTAYSNGLNVNLDNKDVQKALKYYEDSDLDISIADNKAITYTVDSAVRNIVDKVQLVLSLKKGDNESNLYVISEDCEYDATSGIATSKDIYKSLLINNKQPVALYKDTYDMDENNYIIMAFLNDEEHASKIAITKDKDNNIKIRGVYNEKEKNPIDANKKDNLNTSPIKDIPNGTKIYPAYATYNYIKSTINDANIYTPEVYNDSYYTYGTDFNLSYDVLPDDEYFVSMKIVIDSSKDKSSDNDNNKKDSVDEDVSSKDAVSEKLNNVCIYTNQKSIKLLNGKTDNIYTINEKDTVIDGYKAITDITEYYKYVMQCNKNLTKADESNLYGYLGAMNSFAINRWLRTGQFSGRGGGPEDFQPIIETINRKCDENTLDDNLILYRNVGEDYLTSVFDVKLPESKNENVDPFSDNPSIIKELSEPELNELLTTLKTTCINKTYVEKAILSTSMLKTENVFRNLPVHLVIMVPKGTHAFVTNNICESEVIFKPNTKLKFTNVELNYDENGEYTHYILYCSIVE